MERGSHCRVAFAAVHAKVGRNLWGESSRQKLLELSQLERLRLYIVIDRVLIDRVPSEAIVAEVIKTDLHTVSSVTIWGAELRPVPDKRLHQHDPRFNKAQC